MYYTAKIDALFAVNQGFVSPQIYAIRMLASVLETRSYDSLFLLRLCNVVTCKVYRGQVLGSSRFWSGSFPVHLGISVIIFFEFRVV